MLPSKKKKEKRKEEEERNIKEMRELELREFVYT